MMHAVITGRSRGIGAAVGARLERDGWDTTDISRTAGVDVADRPGLDSFLVDCLDVDALVYSAGHVEVGPLDLVADDEWDYHVEVNLTGAFRCLRWFAGLNRPGAVVLIASTAGLRPSPEWAAYAATKAALVNLALTAAAELAHHGVRVYCVAPGRCATQLRRTLAPNEDLTQIMQPTEVADVVAHLIEDEAGVLAGQVIEVARR